ncbi:ABC transporter substrate-binding protein [Nesterenkonia sp. Act20]|uniref:ABC transporter substrate-binding protein n=1 Tax=Nesterenkonia sp. Act20 TaxID=1483432 RepID=UPI002100490D|nr:ABC transporter substrate-binding protein [Nesterenkonia sp. Act20]
MRTTDHNQEDHSSSARAGAQPAPARASRGSRRRSRVLQGVALTSVMTLALTACGGSAEGEDSSGGGAEGEDVTLSVTTFNEFGYEDLFEEYEEINDNITIEHNKIDTAENARDSLRNSLGAGQGASDIEPIEVDWLAEFQQYPDRFEDLTDPELEDRWLDWKYDDAVLEDGRLIGYGTDSGPQAVCYRADLFEEAGLPTDREEVAEFLGDSWEDYFAAGREFVAESDSAWYSGSDNIWQGMINQVEVPYQNEEGEIIADTNPEVKDLYDQLLEASVEDELSAGLAQWSGDWSDAFQREESFATMMCPGWMLGIIEGNAEGVEGWDIANTFPGGGGNWGGSYLTVPSQGENIEEAKKLAAWLTAPEQQLKAFDVVGAFPSTTEALESEELRSSSEEFFNDAPTGEILAERADAVETQPLKGTEYLTINVAIQDAINRVDVDGIDDPEASWEKFVNDMEALR